MKFMKRAQIYKSNNVTFNPQTCEAHSYRWWKFVAKIDGVVIFNDYRYSNTTSKHQSKVRSLLNELNIKIDIVAPFPDGIKGQDLGLLIEAAEENLCDQFLKEQSKIIARNEKAKARRDKIRAQKDAEMKANLESPEFDKAVNEYIEKQSSIEKLMFNMDGK